MIQAKPVSQAAENEWQQLFSSIKLNEVEHPSEYAVEEHDSDKCLCGLTDCPDAYAHTTSGY